MEGHEKARPRRRAMLVGGIAIVVVAVLGGVGLMAQRANGNGSEKKKKDAPDETTAAPVELAEVRRGGIDTYLQSTTTLEARNEASLVARRQGQVMAIPVEEGQWVHKGDPLAQLDDRETRLAVDRAELAEKVAERELNRGRQLREKGYLSPKELDDLELKLRDATVALGQARYDLSLTRIVAPFSGRVVERSINLGETVPDGKECFRIADFDPILARVYFPERDLARVKVGQEARLDFDARPGQSYTAHVWLVNPVVDPANGTFKVTLEVPNPKGMLRPGTFARVHLRTGTFEDALLVPRRGVLSEDGDQYVFVARGDSVQRVPVHMGAVENDMAQILDGLEAGDRIVTLGHGGLKSGAKIRPVTL